MGHIRVKEADEILGDRFRVLDNGYVRLVDYMGGDARIADIAREHYGKSGSDDMIIREAVNRKNKDILGMVEVKLHFEMPIAEAMTFVYERNANVNEFSLRYSEASDVFQNLNPERLNKEVFGSIQEKELINLCDDQITFSKETFDRYIAARSPDADIAKEIARAMLGSNLHTRFYWKTNLADLLDFSMRAYAEDSSPETMKYVEALLNVAHRISPLAVDAFLRNESNMHKLLDLRDPEERVDPKLEHEISPKAEELLDKPFNVLGNGKVILVDYMGNDMSVLNAARVSTGKDEKPRSEAENKGLINYLMRHRHTTPSEMVEFLWKLEIPYFVYRQGGRHRTFERSISDANGNSANISFYHPRLEDIAQQGKKNHQGRGDAVNEEIARNFLHDLERNEMQAKRVYGNLYRTGVKSETAKRHLPVNRMLSLYFKSDLHNVLHYLGLRLDSHAQLEIREPSAAMAETVKAVVPSSYEAFERYELNSVRLSALEVPIIKAILNGKNPEDFYPESWKKAKVEGKNNREMEEFEDKFTKLKGE